MSKSVALGQPITDYARHHSLSSLTPQYLGSTASAKTNQEIVLRRLRKLDLIWETWKKQDVSGGRKSGLPEEEGSSTQSSIKQTI